MTEMRRLKEEIQSSLARGLLESAKADRSSPGARERALAALGIAGVASTVSAAKVAAASGAPAGSATTSAVAGKGGAWLGIKWLALMVVGSGVTAGVYHEVRLPTSSQGAVTTETGPASSASALPASFVVGNRALTPAPLQEPVSQPASSMASLANAPKPKPPASSNARAAPSPPAQVTSAIEETDSAPAVGETVARSAPEAPSVVASQMPRDAQLPALIRIRGALAAHDTKGALALLRDFEQRFPSSPFAEEAMVLRIDALVDAERCAEAAALGEVFLTEHSKSAYVARVRTKYRCGDQTVRAGH